MKSTTEVINSLEVCRLCGVVSECNWKAAPIIFGHIQYPICQNAVDCHARVMNDQKKQTKKKVDRVVRADETNRELKNFYFDAEAFDIWRKTYKKPWEPFG